MGEFGNLWSTEACTSNLLAFPSSSYLSVMHELHVLVVDHDSDSLINSATLLESCQYRVTIYELSSGALQVLSFGKVRVDLIMVDINSPDLHGLELLQQATAMEIPVILMSTDDSAFMALRALESGAFAYLKKPLDREVMKGMWQHVVREKIKAAAKQRELQFITASYDSFPGIGNPNNVILGRNAFGTNDVITRNKNNMVKSKLKRKVCTEWTKNLHKKFMDAVEMLGDGRCFPKEILELMNVPGLTRMQVASHLQKCRSDNWKSRSKSRSSSRQNAPSDPNNVGPHKTKRFGLMPKAISKTNASKETSGEGMGEGMKIMQSKIEVQNVVNMETVPDTVVVTANNNSPYHPENGPITPQPAGAAACLADSPKNTFEDHFLNLMNLDWVVHLPAPQVSAGMDTIASSSSAAATGSGHPSDHQLEQNICKVAVGVDNGSPLRDEATSKSGSDDCDPGMKDQMKLLM